MLSALEIALGLQRAMEELVRETEAALVLQHAVDGVVRIEGLPLARIWTAREGSLQVTTSAVRDVTGRTDGARPWAERVVLDRKPFSSNRLFHGMGTPDVAWMRDNRFRAYAGFPVELVDGTRGVFDCFGMRPLHDDAVLSIGFFVRVLVARMDDLARLDEEVITDTIEIPTTVPYDEAERQFVRAVLARFHGQIEGSDGAAASLGIAPSTLRSRLKRLGIR